MPSLNPDEWKALSPYLDQALAMPNDERAGWLAELHERDPAIADQLQSLLDQHRVLAQECFLEEGPLAAPARTNLAGQTVGSYRLISHIGQGGMGSVWLAERGDGRFERRTAVKFLSVALAGQGVEARFKREGSILARLAHPHVAQLLDAGMSSTGQPFLVLEHVDGLHIDRHCDQHTLDIEARLRLFLDVLAAVAHAHANLIVHRDIKPSNVLVRTDGQVKLLDFGIAKLLETESDSAGATALTREGSAALTLAYAAPEQVKGEPITTATDVYALGILLYVLLTGEHPAGDRLYSHADLVKAIVETEPPRVSDIVAPRKQDTEVALARAARRGTTPDKLRRLLHGDLDTILAKALKKNPQERYASVTAFAEDLRRYLKHQPISARPDTFAYRAAKFVRRNRFSVGAATLALAAIIAGSGVAIYQKRNAQRRFEDVRKLAHIFVFDLHDEIAKLEGSTKARELMVRTALEYLDNLGRNAGSDLDLQKEIAAAYIKIGNAQGVPTRPNLGRLADALASYRKAGDIYRRIGAKNPDYLPDLAKYYLNYATLGRLTHDLKQARELSQSAIQVLDRIQARRPFGTDLELTYIQAWCTLGDLDEDSGHYRQAWTELSRCGELARARLSKARDRQGLSALSQALERIGTAAQELGLLQQGLQALNEEESLLAELLAAEPQNPQFHRMQTTVHNYRLGMYYADLRPNLGDPQRALDSAKRYLDAAEQMVRNDPANTSAQFSRAIATYQVSFSLREFDATAAAAVARNAVRLFDEMIASGKPSYLVTSRRVRALLRLGEAQLKAGRAADARASAQAALDAVRPLAAGNQAELEDDSRILVQVLILSGNASAAAGDFANAESFIREAREEAQKIAHSDELTNLIPLANAEEALGAFYARRRRTEEARACYQRLSQLWQRFPESNEYVDRQRIASERLLASLH